MSVLPLSNLRVANFGWVWVAPLMGHILADMGAEVFKVETRNRPDVIRILPPYMDEELAKEKGQQPLESLYAANTFRNYRGITLDISTGEGQRLAKELIKSCDVVIENFSPKVMGKFGMSYEELRALRPDLIMISASAAGKDGPRSDLVSYGGVVSAMAGIDFNQGYPELGRPQAANTTIMDPLQGIYCAFAVLAAIRHRARTGEGQHIDFAQWEAAATIAGGPMMEWVFNKRHSPPLGNRDEMMAPHGVYPSKGADKWVTIAVKTEDEWRALCAAMERPELAEDDRFADQYLRQINHDALDEIIAAWTKSKTHFQVTRTLQKAGVAAFPSLNQKEVFDDRHYKAREDWIDVDHPLGKQKIYGMPWKLSKTPGQIRLPGTMVGQYNDFAFREVLGMPKEEIDRLDAANVFY